MKWMGWSWEEYLATPVHIVNQVREMMVEEYEAWEKARNK